MTHKTPPQVQDIEALTKNLNQFFLIVNGMLVFLMQCGFAFLEAGSVRSKNSTNILIKNLLDSFVAGIAYWVFGYAFAYGEGNKFIGYHHFATAYLSDDDYAFFFYQYVFAATAATIVSGALAERCEFIAYFIYSFLITGFIYPLVTRWVWSEDAWLSDGMEYTINNATVSVGYQDFAGSGVVHVIGGTASFFGALILGPRLERFHPESNTVLDLRGHSVPFAAMGGFLLLFGFLAFNGGSELAISGVTSGANVSLAVVNTIISGSTSAFVVMLIQKTGFFGTSRWSLLSTLNGALTGMVSVCAGCNVYHPWGAFLVGLVAGVAYKVTSWLIVKLKIDDPLDAIAVHLGGGTWGIIGVAFMDRNSGILLNGDTLSGLKLAWQLAGWAVIFGWTGAICAVMFGLMRVAGILRVPEEVERKGLDIPKHGEPAYPLESYGHGHIERILRILESGQLHTSQQGCFSVFSTEVNGFENRGYVHHKENGTSGAVTDGVNRGFEHPEEEKMKSGTGTSPMAMGVRNGNGGLERMDNTYM